MTYQHGVRSTEVPSSVVPPVLSTAALTVYVGTAPVNIPEEALVNEPVLAYTYNEAVSKLGFSDDFESYTLSEAIDSHFSKFNVAPIVLINVLDPNIHKESGGESFTAKDGAATLKKKGVIPNTLKVTRGAEEIPFDWEFDDKGNLNIFVDSDGEHEAEFDALSPKDVTADEVVGGVSTKGEYKGLELINHVFPKFRLVPGIIVAPKFSTDSEVAAVMSAKASNINGLFKAIALVDVPTDVVKDYTALAAYKNDNNLTASNQIVCWPKVSLGGKQYHLSTQAAGVMNLTDGNHNDVPYKSPSNENLKADSAVLADGTEITLGQDQAAYLNGQGIVTALNFIGGWKLWGNRTAVYPASTDVKDSFIPIRRMFNYVQNNLILTYWDKVDDPTNRKLIETILNSENLNLNGMTAQGYILGGRIEFIEEENPITSLLDGKVRFHVFLASPPPARDIEFLVEFDASYISSLFG